MTKRCAAGFRTTASLREKLEQAAAESGRSLSQEIEWRLEMSFVVDGLAALERRVVLLEEAQDEIVERVVQIRDRVARDG